jgi:hypothetical protein
MGHCRDSREFVSNGKAVYVQLTRLDCLKLALPYCRARCRERIMCWPDLITGNSGFRYGPDRRVNN